MSEAPDIEDIRQSKQEEYATGADDVDTPGEPIYVDSPAELTDAVQDNDVVLVEFFAEWCGPCIAMEDDLAELAAETDAAVAKVDIDGNQGLAAQYDVRGVPTMYLFDDGEPVEQLVGMKYKRTLADLIEQYL